MQLVYHQLRALAGHYLKGERRNHSLGATALVHEAYLRLAGAEVDFQSRIHFLAMAARLMRRVLVDHARARGREKRKFERTPLEIEKLAVLAIEPHPALLDLDEALARLQQIDPRKSDVIELIYFGGLSYEEASAALEISQATLHRDLKMARAWLYNALKNENESKEG
jgi:RNA polymerase sigma factor (TIGR02999 family)